VKGKDAMTRRTHAKTRLSLPHGRQSLRAPLPRILSFVLLAALAACSSSNKPDLEAPRQILAPYDPMAGEVLWAIAPLRNETGTSLLDPLEVSDEIVAAAEQAQGVRALPLNRSLEAMRALELAQISTPAEARQLTSCASSTWPTSTWSVHWCGSAVWPAASGCSSPAPDRPIDGLPGAL